MELFLLKISPPSATAMLRLCARQTLAYKGLVLEVQILVEIEENELASVEMLSGGLGLGADRFEHGQELLPHVLAEDAQVAIELGRASAYRQGQVPTHIHRLTL